MNAPPDLRSDPASAADIDTLLAMTRAFHREDGHPLDAAGEQAVARIARGEPCVRAWIARREGEATGYVVITLGYSIEYGGRDGFIDDLYVGRARSGDRTSTYRPRPARSRHARDQNTSP